MYYTFMSEFFMYVFPKGTAFKDIYVGTYYPALSIYLEATVSVKCFFFVYTCTHFIC